MEIKLVTSDKKEFLDLLLLADEQESMIDRYLERGDMFVLYDDGLKALCVVTREGEGVYEIKNIATVPFFQRQGYGKRLIEFLFEYYQGKCSECWWAQEMYLLPDHSMNIVVLRFLTG